MFFNFFKAWFWKFSNGYDILGTQRIEFQLLVLLCHLRRDIMKERIYICFGLTKMVDQYAEKFGLTNVHEMKQILRDIISTWDKVVLNKEPMVPVSLMNRCPVAAENAHKYAGAIEKWYYGEYAMLRRELLDYVIEQLQIMICTDSFDNEFMEYA